MTAVQTQPKLQESQSVFVQIARDAQSNYSEVAGRYGFQADAERRMLADVMAKLEIEPHHRLLDFGCGPGTLAIPLSFVSGDVTAVDQQASIEIARKRFSDSHVKWVVGGFPGVELEGPFDRIVVYSVLQYLPTTALLLEFIDFAIDLLAPGGRMMIGEMPNTDKRARFEKSAAGKAFAAEWEEMKKAWPKERLDDYIAINDTMDKLNVFNDEIIYSMMRRANERGAHAYLVPEPANLPYGHTRDDLIIAKP
jgi:cyclopropane fatty-acyl-phospholipid synthase-like methyltransferase